MLLPTHPEMVLSSRFMFFFATPCLHCSVHDSAVQHRAKGYMYNLADIFKERSVLL